MLVIESYGQNIFIGGHWTPHQDSAPAHSSDMAKNCQKRMFLTSRAMTNGHSPHRIWVISTIFLDTVWANGMNFSSQKTGLTQVTPKETVGIFPRNWAACQEHNFKFKTSSECGSLRGFFWKLNFYKIWNIIGYYCTNFQRNIPYTFWVIDNESLFAT